METKAKKPKTTKTKEPAGAYKALVGFNYPTASGEVRVEPGQVVSDLPERSVSWLVRDGVVAPVEKGDL